MPTRTPKEQVLKSKPKTRAGERHLSDLVQLDCLYDFANNTGLLLPSHSALRATSWTSNKGPLRFEMPYETVKLRPP